MLLLEKIENELLKLQSEEGTKGISDEVRGRMKDYLFSESTNGLANRLFQMVFTMKKLDASDFFSFQFGKFHSEMDIYCIDSKKQLVQEAKECLDEWRANEQTYEFFFKHQMMKPESEKLRLVVKGKQSDAFTFIKKQEEQELLNHLSAIVLLYFEKYLGLRNENFFSDMIKHYVWLHDNPYMKSFDVTLFLAESFLEKNTTSEGEYQAVKAYLTKWYQEKGKHTVQLYNSEKLNYHSVKDYLYLLNENQRKRMKEKLLICFEEAFTQIGGSSRRKRLHFLKQLKEKVEDVQSW